MSDQEKKVGQVKPVPRDDEIKDFDTIVPDHRWAKIGGEVVDVAMISTETTLRMIKFLDYVKEIQRRGESLESETVERYFQEILSLIADVCREGNPAITVEFLRKRTTMKQVRAFVNFIVEGVVGGGNA